MPSTASSRISLGAASNRPLPSDWAAPEFDDSAWPELDCAGVKGPPEEPFIWVEPDPFLDMQSQAMGIRPTLDWPAQGGTVVYRKTIELP